MSDPKRRDTQQPAEQSSSDAISISPFSSKEEKQKHIQFQLLLILHADKCLRAENQSVEGAKQCSILNCQAMKNVLQHMDTCTDGKSCPVPHCASSAIIISHWKACTSSYCNVCIPVILAIKSTDTETRSNQVPSLAAVLQIHPHLGSPSQPGNSIVNINNVLQSSGAVSDPNNGVQTSHVPSPSDIQQRFIPLGHQPNVGNISVNNNPAIQPSPVVFNPHGAIPVKYKSSKAWHRSMNKDMRNCLVGKIVHAIVSKVNVSETEDERMDAIFEYARKIEDTMYEAADNRDEYCLLIADKVHRIQKETEVKLEKLKDLEEKQEVMPGSGPDFSNDSSVVQSKVFPSWNILRSRLTNGPRYVSSSSFTSGPNTTENNLFLSSESRLPNSININNENESYQDETLSSPPPLVGLQQQQLSQAHLHNMNAYVTTTASASEDSLSPPPYSTAIRSKLFSSSRSQLSYPVNADNQNESYQASPFAASFQLRQLSQAHLHNMSTSVMSAASSSVDSSANPSTLSGTQVTQPSSQVLDNSETRRTALELLRDKEDRSEVDGSVSSDDEVLLTIL